MKIKSQNKDLKTKLHSHKKKKLKKSKILIKKSNKLI